MIEQPRRRRRAPPDEVRRRLLGLHGNCSDAIAFERDDVGPPRLKGTEYPERDCGAAAHRLEQRHEAVSGLPDRVGEAKQNRSLRVHARQPQEQRSGDGSWTTE